MLNKTMEEAIKTIRSNWPDERYTMLREALESAITAIEDNAKLVKALERIVERELIGESFISETGDIAQAALSELRGGNTNE